MSDYEPNFLPCPFCGDDTPRIETPDGICVAVKCTNCAAWGPRAFKSWEATDLWNAAMRPLADCAATG